MLTYFSDHGEDVYDSGKHDFDGRNEAKPTVPMYAVPFLLWRSENWRTGDPRDFAAFVDRTYQTSHFIHTWFDLSGLTFDGLDRSKSLISPTFESRPILVGDPANRGGLIDLAISQGRSRP